MVEVMNESANAIIEELRAVGNAYAKIKKERSWFAWAAERAVPVQVVSIKEVFDENQINFIRAVIDPQPKECYKNAALMTQLFDDVDYVEGQMMAAGILGVDHAFNRIGERYIDITVELALNHPNVQDGVYAKIKEYSSAEVLKYVMQEECYRNWNQYEFVKSMGMHPGIFL